MSLRLTYDESIHLSKVLDKIDISELEKLELSFCLNSYPFVLYFNFSGILTQIHINRGGDYLDQAISSEIGNKYFDLA